MIFRINNKDFSAHIQSKVDVVETPRRIVGRNAFTALDGTYNEDYVTTKYDLSVRLKPLPAGTVTSILEELQLPYVTLIYTSVWAPDGARRIRAVPTASTMRFLTEYAGGRIYGDVVLGFTER